MPFSEWKCGSVSHLAIAAIGVPGGLREVGVSTSMRSHVLAYVVVAQAGDAEQAVSLHGIPQDLTFDYDGCLGLARQLYALADQVTQAAGSLRTLADEAQQGFQGAFARTFDGQVEGEQADFAAAAGALRADAADLARMWKTAMDEENARRYGRHTTAVRAQRDLMTRAWDDLFGEHLPPAPEPVALPQPPGFAPTAELVRYPGLSPTPRPQPVR